MQRGSVTRRRLQIADLPLLRRRFTPEEYLLIERAADTRSEYLDGEIYAMAGASVTHIDINDNLIAAVHALLKGTRCRGMSQNTKVPAGGGLLYAYPDYLIVCGERRFHDSAQDILINPTAIFEILSPSTEQYDRTTKFDLYKQIDTLREYVLIAQDRLCVEHWVRQEDGTTWRQTVIEGIDGTLSLVSAPAAIPLADLYDSIDFAARTDDPSSDDVLPGS